MTQQMNWFDFAEEDRKMADLAFQNAIYNQTCFHCQQEVEKLLKGYLLARTGKYPKSHHLLELLEHCKSVDPQFTELFDECLYLTKYYIPIRYPNAVVGTLPNGLPGKDEAEKTLAIFSQILKFLEERLRP
jgi:HEPN domain-containing protein